MKKYDIFDITKLILAFMVVSIHTKLFPMFLYPWIRLAVPLFFIISSFLLYSKINNSKESRNEIIKHYIFRLLKLYLFWFIVLLPATIYIRQAWFQKGLLKAILNIFIKPLISSTFVASWYIAATILGTIIVDKLSNKINYKILIFGFSLIYLLCCFTSAYSFLFENTFITHMYIEPHCSFLVSLVYILFGKLIAENRINLKKKNNIILIIISLILVYIEWIIIYKVNGTFNKDSYILLLPASILIFNYLRTINVTLKHAKLMRQFSNFIYPFHATLAIFISKFVKIITENEMLQGLFNFIITSLICLIVFFIIKKLEKRFKVLKYSY